jgi:large conductance mechanosensitive channel
MGMVSEFKTFAMKGNLVDMAVGIVIGAAFGTVVSSFIDGVFMPAISPVMGGVDLAGLKYEMSPAVMEAGEVVKEAVVINVGGFLSALISFIIVAFVMFLIIKGMNRAMEATKKKEAEAPAAPAAPPADVVLLTEIRDLLAKK